MKYIVEGCHQSIFTFFLRKSKICSIACILLDLMHFATIVSLTRYKCLARDPNESIPNLYIDNIL